MQIVLLARRIRTSLLAVALGLVVFVASALARTNFVPEPGAWQIELVDHSGSARFTSIKVDDLGNVHVAYVVDDGNRYPLKYAFWDRSLKRWFVMTVAESVGACSLAIDSKRLPHISFADYGSMSGSKLRYAHWNGTTWNVQAIPLNSDVIAYYNSIALDSEGNPSISFYEYRGPKDSDFKIRLRNVMWNGQYWEVRTVDQQEGSGKFNAMVSDQKGHMHIAYANVSAGTAGMRYASWDGQAWTFEILEGIAENNGGGVGYSACIAVDHEGNPHVTYMNETTRQVKYGVRKEGHWHLEVVGKVLGIAYPDRNSIALDENGRPYVGYYDSGEGTLKLAHREGERWISEIVDGNGSGFTSSLQISKGTLWISYADQTNGGLKVARRNAEVGKNSVSEVSMPPPGVHR